MTYQVESFTLFDGWVNCWTDDAENPITFDSREKAQQELDLFLKEQAGAVLCGDMVEAYDINDFRIVQRGYNEAQSMQIRSDQREQPTRLCKRHI